MFSEAFALFVWLQVLIIERYDPAEFNQHHHWQKRSVLAQWKKWLPKSTPLTIHEKACKLIDETATRNKGGGFV